MSLLVNTTLTQLDRYSVSSMAIVAFLSGAFSQSSVAYLPPHIQLPVDS